MEVFVLAAALMGVKHLRIYSYSQEYSPLPIVPNQILGWKT